ncbi:MAG: thioesterase family protein [Anaerolineales bacterium]
MYEKTFTAGWGDMDFNSHMRNTAYLDKSADVRMMYFSENGFPMSEFVRLRIGPVVLKDEVEYFKEFGLLETFKVTLAQAGLSEDGSRFIIRNEFYKTNRKLATRVTSTGGWLDLAARKLIVPPDALFQAMQSLQKTDDFQVLASSIR